MLSYAVLARLHKNIPSTTRYVSIQIYLQITVSETGLSDILPYQSVAFLYTSKLLLSFVRDGCFQQTYFTLFVLWSWAHLVSSLYSLCCWSWIKLFSGRIENLHFSLSGINFKIPYPTIILNYFFGQLSLILGGKIPDANGWKKLLLGIIQSSLFLGCNGFTFLSCFCVCRLSDIDTLFR